MMHLKVNIEIKSYPRLMSDGLSSDDEHIMTASRRSLLELGLNAVVVGVRE